MENKPLSYTTHSSSTLLTSCSGTGRSGKRETAEEVVAVIMAATRMRTNKAPTTTTTPSPSMIRTTF